MLTKPLLVLQGLCHPLAIPLIYICEKSFTANSQPKTCLQVFHGLSVLEQGTLTKTLGLLPLPPSPSQPVPQVFGGLCVTQPFQFLLPVVMRELKQEGFASEGAASSQQLWLF